LTDRRTTAPELDFPRTTSPGRARAFARKAIMTAKKQKEKERRRARKMADEAWQAVAAGNLNLAGKLSRRAVTTQPDNPRLWNDRGRILLLTADDHEADRAVRYAILLARDFAEPYHHLAALRARQDRLDDAVALEGDALRLAPDNVEYAEQLEAYRTAAERQRQETLHKLPGAGTPQPAEPLPDDPPEAAATAAARSERLRGLDWEGLGERLTREGYVLLAEFLPSSDCAGLRALFDNDDLFVKTVVMEDPDFGEGVYPYFRAPIPAAVAGLRRAVYPHVAAVADSWQGLLREEETYPPEWEAFRDRCRGAGQTKSTPILLRYGPGGSTPCTGTSAAGCSSRSSSPWC
jgi:tetratricopeptide (TPR) repeat protein